MPIPRRLLLTAVAVLTACGGKRPAGPTWPLAEPIAIDALAERDGNPAALVLQSADLAARLPTAARPRRVLTFGRGAKLPAGIDAMVVADDGARAAADLALLHCHGITLPARLPLGGRVLTPATEAAGGTARPFAGDFALQMLRNQHAELLTTAPTNDVVFTIGCVRCGDAPEVQELAGSLAAAAKRYPQLVLQTVARPADPTSIATAADELVRLGARAIIVALPATAAPSLQALHAAAKPHRLAVLALDPSGGADADCVIGGDPETCGRALGETLRTLLPLGGAVVPVHATADRALMVMQLRGLAAALAVPAPR